MYQVVQQKIGAGNLAALEQAAGWFANTDPADPISITTLVNNLSAAGSQVAGIIWTDIQNQLEAALAGQLQAAGTRAVAQLVGKLVPWVGGVRSAYQALTWVVNSIPQLGDLFAAFAKGVADAAAGNADTVKNDLLTAFETQLLPKALDFAAAQLGINRLPADLKKALAAIPTAVDTALRKAVDSIAAAALGAGGLAGGAAQTQSTGKLAPERQFDYGGKTYVLWVAQDKSTGRATVKVAVKGGTGPVIDLTAGKFTTAVTPGLDGRTAKDHIGDLITAAQALARQIKPVSGQKPTKDTMTNLVALRNAVGTVTIPSPATGTSSAEDKVVADILANACVALNAGCFAAGVKLNTPDGFKPVETFRVDDPIYSRSEYDPDGPVEVKRVEAIFRRFAVVQHLHAGGKVIRTTDEHPFFEEGRGWVPVKELRPGDRIRTDTGWIRVEEVYDTGEWEVVYNLRVADHHTYFVGDDGWAFSVWAHNAYMERANQAYRDLGNTYASTARSLYTTLQAYAPRVAATIAYSESVSDPLSYVYVFYRPSTMTSAQAEAFRESLIDRAHVVLIPGGAEYDHAERRLYREHGADIKAIGISNSRGPCKDGTDPCYGFFRREGWENIWW